MLPSITIFGHEITMYGLLCLTGIFGAILFGILRAKKCDLQKEDVLYMGLLSAIGIVVGGKILYLLIDIPVIVRNIAFIFASVENLFAYLSGGFVFYGGLFGAIGVLWLYSHFYHLDFSKVMICMTPAFPLAHAIGRLGCFCAGCCYGKNGLPVQLYESVGNLLILLILLLVEYFGDRRRVPQMYLFCYAVLRFGLEFLRADVERGSFLWFSTSQWISIGVLIAAAYIECRLRRKDRNASKTE